MSELTGDVFRFVTKHDLLGQGDHVLVALSGGADSTCLLRVLSELSATVELPLSAAYVNHGLRPAENEAEIHFCRELCDGLGVAFSVEDGPVHEHGEQDDPNLQSRARKLRYALLEKRRGAIGADRIAVAHNASDQAETMLMRFIRGSGPRGLAGIPARRGTIIRPLLDVRRTRIEEHLKDLGQAWCEDSSNRSEKYRRNRVRAEILPLLERENPALVETLTRTASLMEEEEAYLRGEARLLLRDIVSWGSEDEIELDVSVFDSVPMVLRRRLVRLAVEDLGGGYGAGILHTAQVMHTLASGGQVTFPNGVRAERSGDGIRFVRLENREEDVAGFELILDVPGSVALPDGKVVSAAIEQFDGDFGDGKTKAVFDRAKITLPLTVRSRRPGDRMRPRGLDGWKKVQDILVDAKIPRYRRDGIPVVTIAGGEITWLAGVRVDGWFGSPGLGEDAVVMRIDGEQR